MIFEAFLRIKFVIKTNSNILPSPTFLNYIKFKTIKIPDVVQELKNDNCNTIKITFMAKYIKHTYLRKFGYIYYDTC